MYLKYSKLLPKVKLQPHQSEVVELLKHQPALLLYHGLGSGKTLSSIAATEGMSTTAVVPAALRNNYLKELNKFTDTPDARQVLSYDAATKNLPISDALVLDEAHRIGNPATARSQAIIEQAAKFKKRLLLTGTPIRNNPSELSALLQVLDPATKIPTSQQGFDDNFLTEEKVSPTIWERIFKGLKPGSVTKAKNLASLQKAFKGKVHYFAPDSEHFPKRVDSTVKVDMSPEHLDIYNTIINKANPVIAAKVKANFPLSKSEAKSLSAFLIGARIASNSPEAFGGTSPSNKLLRSFQDFKDDLAKNPKHKAITYSNFIEGGIDPYAKLLDAAKLPYGRFTGGLTDKQRKEIVDDYNTGRINNILLSGAGSEGLDLKGTRAIHILEPHWNDPRIEQTIGRGIRFKSHEHLTAAEREVQVRKYLSTIPATWMQRLRSKPGNTSVDEYLANLAAEKEVLNKQFLDTLIAAAANKTRPET